MQKKFHKEQKGNEDDSDDSWDDYGHNKGVDHNDDDKDVIGESEEESQKHQKKSKIKKGPAKDPAKKKRVVFNISDTKYDVVKRAGKRFKWKMSQDPEEEWDIWWTDMAVQPEQLARMKSFQKINHWPGMYSLARKNNLARNLMKMRKQFPNEYNFFPPTWILPAENSDFRSQFNKKQAIIVFKVKQNQAKTFIIKPEAACQGRGIFLTRKFEDIPPDEHYVAQRYLGKPMLIDNFKFDLRIYVLLAGVDPLRIYVYNEGLGRLATNEYIGVTGTNLQDACMHLTNYAVNKDNPNFIFNNDADKDGVGHKRSLAATFKAIEAMGFDTQKI